MSETTPDPADAHTGTDRVELTEDEREQIIEAIYQGRVRACRETVENWGPPEDEADTHSLLLRVLRGESEGFVTNALPVVVSIVAARVQALTAERDELFQQVERLQTRILKADPRPNQPIDDFGGNIRSMYVRVSDGWLRRFDKWRKGKGLSRSGAIRKLVQDAWEADNAR